jgi:hypothetical protein
MFIFFLYLVVWLKKKKKTTQPALMLFRYPSSGRTWFAILFIDASQVPQENTRETACLNVRQLLAVILHLLCVPPFLRGGWSLDMQPLPHYLRRIQFAPNSSPD